MELFHELHQNSWILSAQLEASAARQTANAAAMRIADMEARSQKALMLCETLWTILRDRLGVPEEELLSRLREIDLSDGHLDGKVRRPPVNCGACQRVTTQRMPKCMYCGAELSGSPFSA